LDKATKKRGWVNEFAAFYSGKQKVPIPTYFIHGNHEDFDLIGRFESNLQIAENLYYLSNGRIHNVLGISVAVVGGVYSQQRYTLQKDDPRLKGNRRRNFTLEDVATVINYQQRLDILLTHQAPALTETLKLLGSVNVVEEFRRILDIKSPRYHFFGHHDISISIEYHNIKVIGLQTMMKSPTDVPSMKKWFEIIEILGDTNVKGNN